MSFSRHTRGSVQSPLVVLRFKYEKELSRSYIQKLMKEKNVKVNSTVIKSNYKVAKGDQIQITIPDLTEPDILPENIPLDILYEDDDILVVNKPRTAGILSSIISEIGFFVNNFVLVSSDCFITVTSLFISHV